MNQYEKFYVNLEKLAGRDLAFFATHWGYVKRETPGYMPLSMEQIAKGMIALCHWGEQNGDLMRDPEVIFEVDIVNKTAEPICFRNDYMATGEREVYEYDETGKKVGVRPGQKADLAGFCRAWFRNIKEQGFLEPERIVRSKFENEGVAA